MANQSLTSLPLKSNLQASINDFFRLLKLSLLLKNDENDGKKDKKRHT